MKKIIVFAMALMLVACSNSSDSSEASDNKVSIVTTSFIGYDIATQVAGDKATVDNILPWGSELHDFEPTAKNMTAVNEADLFIYLSVDLESWVESSSENDNALNLSKSYTLEEHEYDDEEVEDEDGHDHASLHFWSDPSTYMQLIEATEERLSSIDPDNKEYYEERAEAYIDEIEALHEEFDEYTHSLDDPTIYFSGHSAMDAFAERYHLTITSLSDEYRPDADLTAQQIETLSNEIESSGSHYLFTEELVEPRVAKQIQSSLKEKNYELTILELHSYHNISKEQSEEGITYADLLRQNINNIKQALGN